MQRDISEIAVRTAARGTQMSVLSWFAQRWTGVILLVFVGAHLVVSHWVAPSGPTEAISAGEVASRLQAGAYRFLDVGLLVVALYHGLNGVLRVVVSAGHVSGRLYYVLLGVLSAIGIALTYFGVVVFEALLG